VHIDTLVWRLVASPASTPLCPLCPIHSICSVCLIGPAKAANPSRRASWHHESDFHLPRSMISSSLSLAIRADVALPVHEHAPPCFPFLFVQRLGSLEDYIACLDRTVIPFELLRNAPPPVPHNRQQRAGALDGRMNRYNGCHKSAQI
jgi:hypothetical protein